MVIKSVHSNKEINILARGTRGIKIIINDKEDSMGIVVDKFELKKLLEEVNYVFQDLKEGIK